MNIVVNECRCPRCGAPEVNPATGLLLVRGSKVHDGIEWCSHCLWCHCWYGEDTNQVTLCASSCPCYSCYPPVEILNTHFMWYMNMDTEEIISDEVYFEREREGSMEDWYELDPRTPVQWKGEVA